MSYDTLKKIDDLLVHGESQFQSIETSLGHFWRSSHNLPQAVSYSTELPCGLHLGAGLANITISSPEIGKHQTQGAMVTIVSCPETTKQLFHTHVEAGPNTSCGLYIQVLNDKPEPKIIQNFCGCYQANNLFTRQALCPGQWLNVYVNLLIYGLTPMPCL